MEHEKDKVVLKQHHCLKGRDVLPVVLRLQQVDPAIQEKDQAVFIRKYSLAAYSSDDLGREFENLTGYKVMVILKMAGKADSLENRRLAAHCAILEANESGPPAGQMIRPTTPPAGTSTTPDQPQQNQAAKVTELSVPTAQTPKKRAITDDPEDRLSSIEGQLKRLKDQAGHTSVEAALGQVRNLASRAATNNPNLVAALETLYDSATVHNHSEAERFKIVLKACREHEQLGPLNTLVTKLLGSEEAKKVATGLEAWKKSVTKQQGHMNIHSPTAVQAPSPVPNPHSYQGYYGPPPPHMWPGSHPAAFSNFRGRGRGRGRGSPSRSQKLCFLCKSPDHFAADCPQRK